MHIAHSTPELVVIFESIRYKIEEEVLPKLDKNDAERKLLEELVGRIVPRNFLLMPIGGISSIIDQL